jgi:proteasome-associated ATPase
MRDWEQKVSELYDKLPSKAPTLVVAVDDALMQVAYPATCEANIGDIVILNRDTMQIVDVTTAKLAGSIGFIRRLIDDTFCEVDFDGSIRVSFNGKPEHKLEKGDRVMLDSRGIVVLQNLGKDDSRYTVSEATNVDWDHIGGLEDAKQQMIEAVELPHKNPKIFKFYNKRPVKGILLYGPPGCGKTMLGKACATSLAKIYSGGNGSNGFIYIKGPEILDRYVGVAEATIRQIFQRAKRHKDSHGYPAVLFIDEADALLAKRGSGISSDVERTIVPMFLTEMDGLEESGALVILATNRSDILDPAIVRDGRIDRKIKVTRPTLRSAEDIVLMNLQDVPLNNGYTKAELAELAAKEVFSPKRILYEITTKASMTRIFTLGHIVNGGMLVGVVDLATSFALQRDLEIGAPMGLRKEDLIAAVDSIERQNRDLNHTDELAEFIHDYKADVVGITRLSQSSK